ncbi:MAG: M1 family metallopeptidase [Salibacteraceae bacterium]
MQKASLFLLVAFYSGIGNAQTDEEYWQQELHYEIEVILDDNNHFLHAEEEITYINNSPDTLSFIIFHLWPNAYSDKSSALGRQLINSSNTSLAFASKEEMGFIDSLSFTLDGKPCIWEFDENHMDICTLYLEKPLIPEASVIISTPFRVKLPSGKISRLGHIGQSYQITQWYPKPAVYDKNGWHPMPYLNQGEFYSEFGSFDVRITLPANYTVGATGDLQSQGEIERLDRLVDETERFIKMTNDNKTWSKVRSEISFPESDSTLKTLHYRQSKVHDFAWFADKRYHVLKGEVELPHSKETVSVWTMFTNKDAEQWAKSIEYMHDAVYYYSLWNGDYPYHQATAVDGTISAGGGMEYPNVTVIGSMQTDFMLETVIMHEVGHNWFYGILGSNERDFPWMDEGMNSFNELRYLNTKYPDAKMFIGNRDLKILDKIGLSNYRPGDSHYLTYLLSARANQDQSHLIKSDEYSSLNYGAIVYSKSGVAFDYLRTYLGNELMDKVMKTYFEAYKFKHPYPEDFRRIAEEVTEEDLSWFFDQILGSVAKIDYKLKKLKIKDQQSELTMRNAGGVSSPVNVVSFFEGDAVDSQWVAGFMSDTTIVINTIVDSVEIDPDWRIPEIRRGNNYLDANRVLKKVEPLNVSPFSIENPRETQLHVVPIVGANFPNGFMPGLAVYNSTIPVRKLNFLIAPMFSTKSITPSGSAEAYYMITPEGSALESIDIGANFKRYTHRFGFSLPSLAYNRFEPYLRVDFRPPSASGLWDHELVISSVVVAEEEYVTSEFGETSIQMTNNLFSRVQYDLLYDHPIYKSSFRTNAELHEDYLRGSIEIKNQINFLDKVMLRSRVFGGLFFYNNSTDPRYNYRMDGQFGSNDYAYDATLLDRSSTDGILMRQMTETHGAFKTLNGIGQSNLGLFAHNLELDAAKIPIGLFSDVGYNFQGNTLYDAGLFLRLAKGFFTLYAPLVFSKNIQNEIDANGRDFGDLIRFKVDFALLDIMKMRRQLNL